MLTRNRGRPTSFVANLGLLRKNKKRVPKNVPIIRKRPGRPRKHEVHELASTSNSVSVLKIAKKVKCGRKKYVEVNEEQSELSSTRGKLRNKFHAPKSCVSKKLALRHAKMRSIAAKKLQRRAALIENLRRYRQKKKLSRAIDLVNNSTIMQNNASMQAPKRRGRKPKPKPEVSELTLVASPEYTEEIKINNSNISELTEVSADRIGPEAVQDSSSNKEAHPVTSEVPIDISKVVPVCETSVQANSLGSAEFTNECGKSIKNSKSPIREFAMSRQELLLSMNCGFRSFDDVLQEILSEVSKTGVVFSSKRQFLQARSNLCDSDEQEQDNELFISSNPVIGTLLEKIGPVSELNKELDAKDALLASVGLARPGVRDALRKRREEKAKQLNRSVMGRLRPNPRPRRYSDMITQKKSLDVSHLPSEAYVPPSDLQLKGFRHSVVKAKLVQAKTRELALGRTTSVLHERHGRGRPRKSSLAVSQFSKVNEARPIHPSVSTRPRRRLDVRHHIEWKFCYGSNEKKSQNPSVQLRKRRHAVLSSDQHPVSPQANEEEEYGEQALTHGNFRDAESYANIREDGKVVELEASQTVECTMDEEVSGSATFSPVNKQSNFRRRHHSILFQRKRPVLAGRTPSEEGLDRPEGSNSFIKSRRPRSPSSDSSSSRSAFRRDYERPFRNGRSSLKYDGPTASEYSKSGRDSHFRTETWSPYMTKNQGSRKQKPGDDASKTDDHDQACRPRRISPGRRLLHHKHDQMRRLTLLDRVVLGLTCSVSQEGDQIHIKQLHAEDLNILTQRLTETGFFIQSLALKTNANNEAEYNIVLTYAPNFDAESRRFHRFNSPSSRDHNDTAPRTVLHSVTQTRDLDVSPSNSTYLDPLKSFNYKKNSEFGNQVREHGFLGEINGRSSSGPAVAVDGVKFSAAHSDDDELLSLSSKRIHDDTRAASPPRPSSSSEVHPFRKSFDPDFAQSADEAKKRLGRESVLGVRQRYPRMRPNFHSLKYSSLRKKHGAYRNLHSKRQSSQRPRSFQCGEKAQERRKSRGGYQYRSDDSDSHLRSTVPCSDVLHPQPPNRTPAASLLHAEAGDAVSYIPALSIMFRRHSPRKLIRKVYTGTSTVPKILNRKRPTIPVAVSAGTNQTAPGATINEGSSTLMTACSTAALPSSTLVAPHQPSSVVTMNPKAASVVPQPPAALVPPPSTRPVALSVLEQTHLVGRPPSASVATSTSTNAAFQVGSAQSADITSSSIPTAVAVTASEDSVATGRAHPFLVTKMQTTTTTTTRDAQNLKCDSALPASTSLLYFPTKVTQQGVEPSATELVASTSRLSNVLKSGVPTKTMPLISVCESPPSNSVARIQSPAKKRPFTPSGSAADSSDVVKDESVSSDQRPHVKAVIDSGKSGLRAGDDVYNPAMSMSASQLLKLKKMHDEPSRPGMGEPHRLYSRNQVLAHQLTSSQTRLPSNQSNLTKMSQLTAPTTAAVFPRPVFAADVGAVTDEETGADFELESLHTSSLPSPAHPSHPVSSSSHDSGSGQLTKPPFSPASAAAQHHHILAQSLAASSSLPTPIVTSQVSPGKVFSVRGLLPQLNPASSSAAAATAPRPFSTNVLHYVPGLHPITAVRQSLGSPFPDHMAGRLSVTTPAGSALKITDSNSIATTYLSGRPIFSTGAVTTTTMTLSGGKRPIVHKYHSFRKISPKTDDPIAGTGKRVDSDASCPQKSGGLHPSQLLKSLLECGGANRETTATAAATSPVTTASNAAVMPGIPVGSGSSVWNQPAHHSRGTWQLGGRAVVLGATRASAAGSSGPAPPRAGTFNRVPPISAAAVMPPAATAPKISAEPAVTPSATSMLSASSSNATTSMVSTGSHEELLSSDAVPQAALHETIES